jgi:hypothetical protein
MRGLSLLFIAAIQMPADDRIHALGLDWDVPVGGDWKVEGGVLELGVPRPSTQPRRPTQYALARTQLYSKLVLEFEVKQEPAARRNRRNSVMIVYAWRDRDHFNYVHLSVDEARKQAVHNGIFHVYGGERVRISREDGPASFLHEDWHKVRFVYDSDTGRADVWVNGVTSPSLRGVDLSLGTGRWGVGSFFDMGSFRNLKYSGTVARP